MAAKASIKVEGLRDIQKSLTALGAEKAEFTDNNLEAAQTLIKSATPLVPRKSGKLASTLKAGKTANYAVARAGLGSVPYANPIHWGWTYDAKRFIYRNIKPQPFFTRALGYSYEEIIANYDKNLQKLIDKYGLGAGLKND
jgi:hypothetical protein